MENLTKVQKVLFDTAFRFYQQIGKTDQEASYRAYIDIQKKFDIPTEKWIDITTGKKANINH